MHRNFTLCMTVLCFITLQDVYTPTLLVAVAESHFMEHFVLLNVDTYMYIHWASGWLDHLEMHCKM